MARSERAAEVNTDQPLEESSSDARFGHSSNPVVDRRRFLFAAAAGCTAVGLGGLRAAHNSDRAHAASADGATSHVPGARGADIQVGETLPPPTLPPRTWRNGQFVTHVNVAERMMAFTFDDGPSPWNTESVLRTLDSFGIKATFFLIGVNVRSFPALAKRTHEAGHELGNHSVYHSPYRASPLAAQIGPNQDIIRDATGATPIVNRAPGLTKGQPILDTCANYGLYECHTAMVTNDWKAPRRSASQLYSEFTRGLTGGTFALYHDGGPWRPTSVALPDMIRYAQAQGYKCVTATELMMSGIPQPVTTHNQYVQANGSTDAVDAAVEANDPDSSFVDVCNYDAAAALREMLNGDLSITYTDRMRIVEALADLEAHAKAG